MSGVCQGKRIESRREYINIASKYHKLCLSTILPYLERELHSGSFCSDINKQSFGDMDLILQFCLESKNEAKEKLIYLAENSLYTECFVYKDKKRFYYNSGEIISLKFMGVQIDNIVSLSNEETNFKKNFLDLPAEKQGLLLGLIKVANTEFYSRPSGLYGDYNISSVQLQFRTENNDVLWESQDWKEVEFLLSYYNIKNIHDTSFDELYEIIKKLSQRSQNRIAGLFKKMISIKSGEVGTEKAFNKQMYIDKINQLIKKEI